jgi:Phosphatidylinositol-specific phospholipase C, X domain
MTVVNQTALHSSNWMSYLPDRTRLFDVLVPGSHDTATFAYTQRPLGWTPASWVPNLTSDLNATTFVQTNEERADFRSQLDQGLRFWDLRVRKVSDEKGNNLMMFHGGIYVNTSLREALSAAQRFLQDNPGETLVISLKREGNFTETASREIEASDIQAYLDQFNANASLPAASQGFWVSGPADFARIVEARERRALADLNAPGSGFELEIRNPRTQPGVKLNYENLALGDVRGKVVLHMRDFSGYEDWNDSGVVALDSGRFTSGLYFQDDYAGPAYADKKTAIVSAAKGRYGGTSPSDLNKRYSWNSTSATLALADIKKLDLNKIYTALASPADYALTINSGSTAKDLKTDNTVSLFRSDYTPSLKGLLSPGGELQAWNLAEKRAGASGLRGAMVGDYYLAPQQWYDDFWNNRLYSRDLFIPDLNAPNYAASDHLSQAIWRQNALYGVSFEGASLDPVIGLPVYREGARGTVHFLPYLGNPDRKGVLFQVAQVEAAEAGLSSAQIAAALVAPRDAAVRFDVVSSSRAARRSVLKSFDATDRTAVGAVREASPSVSFTVQSSPGIEGYRFFRLAVLDQASMAPIGGASSYVFAVTDTLA